MIIKIPITIALILMCFMNISCANDGKDFMGKWVAWRPTQNSFEGQVRQVVNVDKQGFGIGRLVPQIENNKVIGAIIPEKTYSKIQILRSQVGSGYSMYECIIGEIKYLMIFKDDEMMLIDPKTKMTINFFHKENIESPQFLRLLQITDGAADSIENFSNSLPGK